MVRPWCLEKIRQGPGTSPRKAKKVARARKTTGETTVRVNWSLKRQAKTIAEQAGTGGPGDGASQGGYVSKVLVQRVEGWNAALEYLLACGWTKRQIREVLEELPSVSAFPLQSRAAVRRATSVQVNEAEARALILLALEWNAGNAEVARQL